MKRPKFTAKQRLFIEFYLETLNATEAAARAGYKGNRNTLGVVGYDNLRKPKLREEINRRLTEKTMPKEEVLYRLTQQAKGDMSDFLDIDAFGRHGGIDLKRAADHGVLHMIKRYTRTRQGTTIELYDAQAALVHLGRAYGLFKDKLEIIDWRKEAEAAGIDASSVFNEIIAQFVAIIEQGD